MSKKKKSLIFVTWIASAFMEEHSLKFALISAKTDACEL